MCFNFDKFLDDLKDIENCIRLDILEAETISENTQNSVEGYFKIANVAIDENRKIKAYERADSLTSVGLEAVRRAHIYRLILEQNKMLQKLTEYIMKKEV